MSIESSGADPISKLEPQTSQVEQIEALVTSLRMIAQPCARDATSYLHSQVADIKHDHRTNDGKPIVPIIEISGYPEPKQIEAPLTPALPPPDHKH